MSDKKTSDQALPRNKPADKTTADESPIARRHFLLGAGTAVAAGLAPYGAGGGANPAGVAGRGGLGRARTPAHAHRDRSIQEKSAIECGGLSYFLPKYVFISPR
jgi:hypothetical protein